MLAAIGCSQEIKYLLDFDFDPQLPSWAKRLAVFDLETTGLDVNTSRIVTACVAVLNQNGETESVTEWLVNPGIEIPEAASRVHGVTTEVAQAKGSSPQESVVEIVQLLRGLNTQMPLVAFNASYDFSILRSEALRYSIEPLDPRPVIDPLVVDRKLEKYRPGKKNLATLSTIYKVELSDAHNSTADAVAAGQLAQRMAAKYSELDIDPSELHDLQSRWADEWQLSMQEFLKKQNRPDFRAELGWPIKS